MLMTEEEQKYLVRLDRASVTPMGLHLAWRGPCHYATDRESI